MKKNLIKDGIVDLAGVAELLGVSESTPHQWRNRTRRGELPVPFPDPDASDANGWVTRPRWKITTIRDWYARHRSHARGGGPRIHARKVTPPQPPSKSNDVTPGWVTAEERGAAVPPLMFSHAA